MDFFSLKLFWLTSMAECPTANSKDQHQLKIGTIFQAT
jgi:hypothetical protein